MNSTEREIYDKYAYKKTYMYLVYEEFERRVNATDNEYEGLKRGECSFNYSAWEKRIGISKKLLQKSIKQLVEDNVIIQMFKGGKGRGSSKYFLTRFDTKKVDNNLDNKMDNDSDNYKVSVSNGCSSIVDNKTDNYSDNKMDNTSIYNNLNIESNNIYSDLNSEEYMKKIDSIWERIISNYDSDLIEKEKAKLTDKKLSGLILLEELERNLESNKKEIKRECSKDIETIFECWNSKGIIRHKTLSTVIKKSIEKSLRAYKVGEIVQAINIYSEILNSQFYFNYKWSLSDFLNRKNGMSTFMDEGSNKANYEAWKKGEDKNGYTKGHTDKPTKRFTEGAEDINYKPEEFKGPSYTEEDYKRMYESGELI